MCNKLRSSLPEFASASQKNWHSKVENPTMDLDHATCMSIHFIVIIMRRQNKKKKHNKSDEIINEDCMWFVMNSIQQY